MASHADRRLSGKVALVTGGSRGIGRAVAAAYARQGARVFIYARNRADVDRAVADIRSGGGDIHGYAGDVGDAQKAKTVTRAVRERFGRLDVLVNNASALGPRVPIAEYPLSSWQEVVRVNLTGAFLLIREALQMMIPQKQGSIINVSSGVGRIGRARWGAYAVSKFGIEGLTQVLADELRETGIRVNAVNPGPTRTEMRAAAYPEEDPLTLPTPHDITPIFVYLAADDSAGITGQSLEAQEWLKR
jgi:NAD(P)-dependent dehydrogenase (short-subunit alcohol dehydrogenase family)